MLQADSRGAVISLNDRMFDPTNDFGEQLAVFQVDIGLDGDPDEIQLTPGKWHDVRFDWDLSKSTCDLSVNGNSAGELRLRNRTLNGIHYIRFRSAAQQIDTNGVLIDNVVASIEDPFAPRCSEEDQIEHEKRYIADVVSHWR